MLRILFRIWNQEIIPKLNVFLQKNDLTVAEAKAVLNTDGTEGSDGDVSAVQSRLEEQQNEIQELKKTLAEQREEAEKQTQRAGDLGNQLEEKVSAATASHVNSQGGPIAISFILESWEIY